MMLLLLVSLARADDPEADPAPPAPPPAAPATEEGEDAPAPATTPTTPTVPAAKAPAPAAPAATPPLTLPTTPTPVSIAAPPAAPILDIPLPPTPPPAVPSPADTDLPDPEPLAPQVLASPNDRLKLNRTDTGWEVVNDDGRKLTADRFAEVVGDIHYFVDRDADLKRVRAARTGLYITGATLFVGAVVAAAVDGPRAPDESNYLVDPDNYGSYEQYQSARDSAEAAWEEDYGRYREGRWWSAAFCAASGTFAIVSAPLLGRDVRERRIHPDHVWTEKRAKEMIERHNKAHELPTVTVTPVVGVGVVGLVGTF